MAITPVNSLDLQLLPHPHLHLHPDPHVHLHLLLPLDVHLRPLRLQLLLVARSLEVGRAICLDSLVTGVLGIEKFLHALYLDRHLPNH